MEINNVKKEVFYMFSAILSGPIWVEIAASMFGKALITGGLTVIKASPEIKNLVNSMMNTEDQKVSQKVIDVFKDIK